MSNVHEVWDVLYLHQKKYGYFHMTDAPLPEKIEKESMGEACEPPRSANYPNMTLRCIKHRNKPYLFFSYGSNYKDETGIYMQGWYFEATIDALNNENLKNRLFRSCIQEASFRQIGANPKDFKAKGLDLKISGDFEPYDELESNPDLLTKLACNWLYNGTYEGHDPLIIVIPRGRDHLTFCKQVFFTVAKCIPYGLRRYLGFATNPNDKGKEMFPVYFAPEECVSNYQSETLVRIKEDQCRQIPPLIPEEVQSIIRKAASDSSGKVLRQIYEELERPCEGDGQELRFSEYKKYWEESFKKSELFLNEPKLESIRYVAAHLNGFKLTGEEKKQAREKWNTETLGDALLKSIESGEFYPTDSLDTSGEVASDTKSINKVTGENVPSSSRNEEQSKSSGITKLLHRLTAFLRKDRHSSYVGKRQDTDLSNSEENENAPPAEAESSASVCPVSIKALKKALSDCERVLNWLEINESFSFEISKNLISPLFSTEQLEKENLEDLLALQEELRDGLTLIHNNTQDILCADLIQEIKRKQDEAKSAYIEAIDKRFDQRTPEQLCPVIEQLFVLTQSQRKEVLQHLTEKIKEDISPENDAKYRGIYDSIVKLGDCGDEAEGLKVILDEREENQKRAKQWEEELKHIKSIYDLVDVLTNMAIDRNTIYNQFLEQNPSPSRDEFDIRHFFLAWSDREEKHTLGSSSSSLSARKQEMFKRLVTGNCRMGLLIRFYPNHSERQGMIALVNEYKKMSDLCELGEHKGKLHLYQDKNHFKIEYAGEADIDDFLAVLQAADEGEDLPRDKAADIYKKAVGLEEETPFYRRPWFLAAVFVALLLILSIPLAHFVLLPKLAEHAEVQTSDGAEGTQQNAVISLWEDCLALNETLNTDEQWAWDYVDSFLDSGSWEDLSLARLACELSLEDLKTQRTTPLDKLRTQLRLDDGLTAELDGSGMEQALDILEASYREEAENLSATLETLNGGLVCLRQTSDILRQYLASWKTLTEARNQCLRTVTNDVLLQLEESSSYAEAWGTVSQRAPQLFQNSAQVLKAYSELSRSFKPLSEELEPVHTLLSEIESGRRAEKDYRSLCLPLSGHPTLLPLPDWAEQSEAEVSRTEKTTVQRIGQQLSVSAYPDTRLTWEAPSQEEASNYLKKLRTYGAKQQIPSAETREAAEERLSLDTYNILLSAEQETVRLAFQKTDMTVFPSWYLKLDLKS